MEKFFSLDNMSKNIFTESSSTFREFPNTLLSKNHNIYANAIKEAIAISDNMVKVNLEEAFKDTLYRIKETEKNISKNILFEDYAFNLKFVKPNISEINRPIHVYHYKNLCDSNSPNLCKLNEQLDKFITVLNRFKSIGNYTDKQAFCEFLNENSSKLLEECHNINNDVLGCKDEDPIDNLDFIKNSYSHFRDLDDSPLGEEYSAGIPTRECVEYIKNEHIDIPTGVKGYNSELTSTIHKINTVLSLLDSVYTDFDFEVKEAKKKFKHAFIVYTSKYLSRANIAYSIKYINICEFLNPNNDSDNESFKFEGCDVLGDIIDNDIDDILMESFEDIISNESEVYKEPDFYVPKLLMMETEFVGLLTQEIMNEGNQPQPANPAGGGTTGGSSAPAAAPANGNGTNNQPATNGNTSTNDKSIIDSALDKIKELWQLAKNFFANLFGKSVNTANQISIKAQKINVKEIFNKYNGGADIDPNLFPKLKAGDYYAKGMPTITQFINDKLPNVANSVNNILNFKDTNAVFNKTEFIKSILGNDAGIDENGSKNLSTWAKNYFFGNDNKAQEDQEYQFGSGVSEEAFKNLQDFASQAATNANSLQNTMMTLTDKVSQYMINSVNAVKNESTMIEISKYNIERVLEEYFGKDYDEIIQEGNFGKPLTPEQQEQARKMEERMKATTGKTGREGLNNTTGKSEVKQGESEKKEEEKQQEDPKTKEKEARITTITNASNDFIKVIETLCAAASYAINTIGNDWIRIANVIDGIDNNQQQQTQNGNTDTTAKQAEK